MTVTQHQRIRYLLADYISGNIAWFIFNLIRYYTLPENSMMSLRAYYSMDIILLGQLLFPMLLVMLYAVSGYYNEVVKRSRVDEVFNTYAIALLASIIIFFIALFNDPIEDRLQNMELLLSLWLLIGTFAVIPRIMLTNTMNRRIRKRIIAFDTMIVGTSGKAIKLAEELDKKYVSMGMRVVGFVTFSHRHKESRGQLPVIGIEELPGHLERHDVRNFIIVNEDKDAKTVANIINRLIPTGRSIYLTPDSMHLLTARPRTQMVSGELLIDITRSQQPSSTRNIKRICDLLLSSVTLVVISPLICVLAVMVRLSSPGPVIFSQERIGLNKKPFKIYKFRTMYTDSEANGPALSSDHDPRITPTGKVLRKYRLDELPQFWNVIKGDMSIVGPRPERAYYIEQIIAKAPFYSLLQQVRPGITSWGMVKYGYANNVDQMIERAKYDLVYIDNMSMTVDLKILIYTVKTILTGQGV